METRINMGKIDGYNIGRKNCEVVIDMKLITTNSGDYFRCSASVYNNIGTDIIMGGQCLDELLPYYNNNALFNTIYRLWQQYHLNDMHAGTIKQDEAIEKWKADGNKYDYAKACDYLDSIGLLYDDGYKYGSSWLYRPIPADDLQLIKDIIAGGCTNE